MAMPGGGGGLTLQEVCYDVSTEPRLQPLSNETLEGRSAIREENARVDVAARGFWGDGSQKAYFASGCLTLAPRPISPWSPKLYIFARRKKSDGSTSSEYVKLSMAPLHRWYSRPPEEWAELQVSPSSGLRRRSRRSARRLIHKLSRG